MTRGKDHNAILGLTDGPSQSDAEATVRAVLYRAETDRLSTEDAGRVLQLLGLTETAREMSLRVKARRAA